MSEEALAQGESIDDFWLMVDHRAVLGHIAFAEDRLSEAVEILEPAWRLIVDRGLGDLSITPAASVRAEALALADRPEDATRVIAVLRACPVGSSGGHARSRRGRRP